MTFCNTPEELRTAVEAIRPVYVYSRKHGRDIEMTCGNALLVHRDLVLANTYNPNSVPQRKMEQLEESFLLSGVAFAVAVIYDPDLEKVVIVDGFHRNVMCREHWMDMDHIPVVVLSLTMAERMLATIHFNKARGHHQVDLDAEVIRKLLEQGMDEAAIADKLKIEEDTVHRYKQLTGVAELFKNTAYSASWEMVEEEEAQ